MNLEQAFITPFDPNKVGGSYKRRSFGHTPKQAGVYLIKEDGLLVYIGMSRTNVSAALYRHFYPWHDGQKRVTYLDDQKEYSVAVIELPIDQAHETERALIFSLRPRDNDITYEHVFAANGEQEDDLPF